MYKFISNLRNLDEYDVGLVAVTGISIGAIIGMVKENLAKKFSWIFALVGFFGAMYLILKIFSKDTIAYDKITPIKFEG